MVLQRTCDWLIFSPVQGTCAAFDFFEHDVEPDQVTHEQAANLHLFELA